VFGGLLIPQGFILLMRVIPRESMGAVFGLFGPLIAVSSISGPVVAGLLIEADPFGLSWRSVFLLNVLFGVLMLAAGLKAVPRFGGDASVRIRPGAALTLMAGLSLLLIGLVDGGANEWTNRAVTATTAGAAVLAAFGRQQARTTRPLLERSLFGNRGFVAGLVFGALFFGTVTGVMYVTTLYLQQGLGLSPFHAALVTAPVSAGIIAASFTARSRIVSHGRGVVSIGVLLFALGLIGLTIVIGAEQPPVPLIAVPLFVAGLGMGCCFGAVFAVALGEVSQAQAGSASGVLNAVQQIVNAAGSATVSTVYLATATPSGPSSGVLPCLLLTLAITVACAMSIPLLPRRGALLH
jgi:hypothetical protein